MKHNIKKFRWISIFAFFALYTIAVALWEPVRLVSLFPLLIGTIFSVLGAAMLFEKEDYASWADGEGTVLFIDQKDNRTGEYSPPSIVFSFIGPDGKAHRGHSQSFKSTNGYYQPGDPIRFKYKPDSLGRQVLGREWLIPARVFDDRLTPLSKKWLPFLLIFGLFWLGLALMILLK